MMFGSFMRMRTPEVAFCNPVPEIIEFIQAELDRHGESFQARVGLT